MSQHSPAATTAGAEENPASTCSDVTEHQMSRQAFHAWRQNDYSSRPPVLGCEREPTVCGSSSAISRSGNTEDWTDHPSDFSLRFQQAQACGQELLDQAKYGNYPEIPKYLLWASSLMHLLDDPVGTDLFLDFLKAEQCATNLLFWFACEGIKKEKNEETAKKVMHVIYRTYVKRSPTTTSTSRYPINLDEGVRARLVAKFDGLSKDSPYVDTHVFDEAQLSVVKYISENEYPMFLQSDIYMQYVRTMQSRPLGDGSEEEYSSSSSSHEKELVAPMGSLPILHEDSELQVDTSHRLTQKYLIATQTKRAIEPCIPTAASMYTIFKNAAKNKNAASEIPNPYHLSSRQPFYTSYNPVSRQDSELQSLSSDAYTSDSASVTNSSVDGSRYRSAKRHQHTLIKQMRENAGCNRDPNLHTTIIPRTQRMSKENYKPMKPEEFFKILCAKLEFVAKTREMEELLTKKLLQGEGSSVEMVPSGQDVLQHSEIPLATSTDTTSCPEDQIILENHFSRIWPKDETPKLSPRACSPDNRRRPTDIPTAQGVCQSLQSPSHAPPQPFPGAAAQHYVKRHTRKDKDGVSIMSSDSGNVRDYLDSAENSRSFHRLIPKSMSMPDCGSQKPVEPSHMYSKESLMCRPSRTCRTLTELTDSGVSVVSESPSCQIKDSRVINWLLQNNGRQMCGDAGYAHSDSSSKHRSSRSGGPSASSAQRQARTSKKSSGGTGSRSSSQERGTLLFPFKKGATWSDAPKQPFVADPCMPPIDNPHTATQLEEASRRLAMMDGPRVTSASKQRHGMAVSGKSLPLSPSTEQASGSGHSTLKKNYPPSSSASTLSRAPSDYTTVMFTFCDEAVPYRTKITNKHLTLREFKELLPKKGTYRYYFKTECDDVDTKVVNEEVIDDNEIVPLLDGKIMAQVKPVE